MTPLLCFFYIVILSIPVMAAPPGQPTLPSPTQASEGHATPRGQNPPSSTTSTRSSRPSSSESTSTPPSSSSQVSNPSSPASADPIENQPLPNALPNQPLPGTISDDVVRFKITAINMEIERSGRVLNAPRIATLQVSYPQIPLQERRWIGRKLGVYRQIFIPGQEEGTQVSVVDTSRPIGYLKILSAYEMTIQAQVVSDDLSKLSRRSGRSSFGPKVIRIGDVAQEVEPPPPPPKKKVVRKAKPKKTNKYKLPPRKKITYDF